MPLIAASKSPPVLARRLKKAELDFPVLMMRVSSKHALPRELRRHPPDHFTWLRSRAYEAIGEARKRINDRSGFYAADEIKVATYFLQGLRSEAGNLTGKKPGDAATSDENRRMLRAFLWYSQKNKSLKALAAELEPDRAPDVYARSLSTLMRRFSQRVADVVRKRSGGIPESYLQYEKSWGRLSAMFGTFEEWPGVIPNCMEHGYALCEALRYFKEKIER